MERVQPRRPANQNKSAPRLPLRRSHKLNRSSPQPKTRRPPRRTVWKSHRSSTPRGSRSIKSRWCRLLLGSLTVLSLHGLKHIPWVRIGEQGRWVHSFDHCHIHLHFSIYEAEKADLVLQFLCDLTAPGRPLVKGHIHYSQRPSRTVECIFLRLWANVTM